ncbi:MAG: hypothetical protein GX094_02425 [Clostridiales bacterium]|jgi:hypothetical protein|nr:hypothetical protein [Clostridiales bacterium]
MSLRPIDIQISIQRSGDYTKEANLQNQKPNINQLANIREFQYQIDHARRKVVSTGQTYYKRISKEANERRQPRQDNADRQDGSPKEMNKKTEIKTEADIKGANIDIKV